jgi:hypothetical protein
MTGIPFAVTQLLHLLATAACGWLVLAAFRWIRHRSAVVGAIVGITILVRAVLGLALFWISYLEIPILASLQMGGGFWLIAPDATGYYELAAGAADTGKLVSLNHAVPAPLFVDVLALWMRTLGVVPAAGMFLNLCLYVAFVMMVVWCFSPVADWRRDLPCIIGVAAYSFSPVVLLYSTQPLKDELSYVLIGLACLGIFAARRLLYGSRGPREALATGIGAVAVGAATFGTTGIRWYNGAILLGSVVLVIAIFAIQRRPSRLPRYLVGSATVLVAAWLGFWGGSGPFYDRVLGANLENILAWQAPRNFSRAELTKSGTAAIRRIAAIPSDLINMTQISRTGFLASGGNTNIVVPLRDDAKAGLAQEQLLEAHQRDSAGYRKALAEMQAGRRPQEAEVRAKRPESSRPSGRTTVLEPEGPSGSPRAAGDEFKAVPITVRDHVKTLGTGLAAVFVPVSLLGAVSRIKMPGSWKSWIVTDLDTVFLDVTVFLVLALLWRRRRYVGDRLPVVVFALIVSATSATLLGYVVTNYGTLWRLRAIVAVPLWVLVVALSPRAEADRESSTAEVARSSVSI